MENNLMVREYLGNAIEFKVINGEVYANATQMCKAFDKEPKRFFALDSTKRYELAIKERVGKDVPLILSGNGRGNESFIHEKLTLKLAQWLNIDFELWCDEQIATLIRDGKVELIQDSYMIENPIDRAKRWIEEQQEKEQLKLEVVEKTEIIEEQKPLVELAEERLSKYECVSITDVTRTYELKRGQLTKWANQNGYIHKTITEVNLSGLEYFKIYDNGGYKNIGITKKGLKFIEINLDDIKQL